MKKIALIVEGKGEVEAAGALVTRSAKAFGQQIFVDEPAIQGGEAKKLRRGGYLEGFLELAATRENCAEVLILLDLDDDCPKVFAGEFNRRAQPVIARFNKPIHICFCVREYESWFLSDIAGLAEALPDYGIVPWQDQRHPETIRGAKEELGRLTKRTKYKPVPGQKIFTQKLNIKTVARNSRSFRKFLKCLTGLTDQDLLDACQP